MTDDSDPIRAYVDPPVSPFAQGEPAHRVAAPDPQQHDDPPDPQRQEDLVLTLVTAAGDAGMDLDVLTEAAELSDVWSDGIVTTLQRAGKVLLIPDADPVDPGLFEVRWRVVAVDRGTP